MNRRDFDPKTFLATIGEGRKVVAFPKKQTVFSQWDAAGGVFYIQQGKVRLTVVSNEGKEATLGILSVGDFFGEGSLAGQALRRGSATAMTDCEQQRVSQRACIAMEVSSSNFPRFDRNLNTGEAPGAGEHYVPATNTIYHDAERPSALVLPVVATP
jgi:hypothetical protein